MRDEKKMRLMRRRTGGAKNNVGPGAKTNVDVKTRKFHLFLFKENCDGSGIRRKGYWKIRVSFWMEPPFEMSGCFLMLFDAFVVFVASKP